MGRSGAAEGLAPRCCQWKDVVHMEGSASAEDDAPLNEGPRWSRVATSFRRRARPLARRIVPAGRRAQVRAFYNRATAFAYAGDAVHCTCCERSFGRFRPYARGRGDVVPMCPWCGSLPRHRVDWLFLRERIDSEGPIRLLHVAPEPGIRQSLQALPNVEYLSADLNSAQAMAHFDVQAIPLAEESLDAIVCNHVLEHVDDDRKAMAEFHRILRAGGWALLQVPFDDQLTTTFEDPSVTDPRERERLFGQHDHVRLYGRDYADRLREAGFVVEVVPYGRRFTAEEVTRWGLDETEVIHFCRKPSLAT
jgi:Methyltransferase domain